MFAETPALPAPCPDPTVSHAVSSPSPFRLSSKAAGRPLLEALPACSSPSEWAALCPGSPLFHLRRQSCPPCLSPRGRALHPQWDLLQALGGPPGPAGGQCGPRSSLGEKRPASALQTQEETTPLPSLPGELALSKRAAPCQNGCITMETTDGGMSPPSRGHTGVHDPEGPWLGGFLDAGSAGTHANHAA